SEIGLHDGAHAPPGDPLAATPQPAQLISTESIARGSAGRARVQAVAGALGGAAVGAAASSGTSEQRTYEVVVRFDDGGYGQFVYAGYSPFRPGERVAVTPGGLAPAG